MLTMRGQRYVQLVIIRGDAVSSPADWHVVILTGSVLCLPSDPFSLDVVLVVQLVGLIA
jgi:hypothetical protein